jgi:hypothetical protein
MLALFIEILFMATIIVEVHALFVLAQFTDKHVFAYNSTSTLVHTLIFLKCMVNKHVVMNLVSFNTKFTPY